MSSLYYIQTEPVPIQVNVLSVIIEIADNCAHGTRPLLFFNPYCTSLPSGATDKMENKEHKYTSSLSLRCN